MRYDPGACDGCNRQPECALLAASAQLPASAGAEIRQQQFRADAAIVVDGDSLLAVKSGVVKTLCRGAQGHSQVLAFSFPGDLFGLEELSDAAQRVLQHSAAVSMTTVCRLQLDPYAVRRASPQFCQRVSAELAARIRDQIAHRQIVATSAPVRIAHWLLQCLRAAQSRGGARCAKLPAISRADIASYLHLRAETVSRVLAQFRRNGWVCGPLHRLDVCDTQALTQLAYGAGASPVSHREVVHG
jgi:CRP/FNR family transcriptional regulator